MILTFLLFFRQGQEFLRNLTTSSVDITLLGFYCINRVISLRHVSRHPLFSPLFVTGTSGHSNHSRRPLPRSELCTSRGEEGVDLSHYKRSDPSPTHQSLPSDGSSSVVSLVPVVWDLPGSFLVRDRTSSNLGSFQKNSL